MECRKVWTYGNQEEDIQLTQGEEKFVRALERLSKMNPGRIMLMGTGELSVRLNTFNHRDNIDHCVKVSITCEGVDGGDDCDY